MENIKLIPNKNNVTIRNCFNSQFQNAKDFRQIRFELHSLCDIPILTFLTREPEDTFIVPVNFKVFPTWPISKNLTIMLQQFDLSTQEVIFQKEIVLGHEDTYSLALARIEQQQMKKRQIGAIMDFIHSDFIEFAGLKEIV